jgi:hypothetical protein
VEVREKAHERARGGDAGFVRASVTNAAAWLEGNRQWSRA